MMEKNLIFLIYFCAFLIGVVWFLMGLGLLVKRHQSRRYHRIEVVFSNIVGQHLYGKGTRSKTVKAIKRSFLAVGVTSSNPQNVQLVIDLMIRTQRMLLGKNYEKLKLLYPQLPPYNESIKKVRSWYWYKKARGIREIYEMNQSQYLKEITQLRNHRNLYVRREAQIALVVFLGWRSLRFLPYLKHNITLWQQIKIVEKLHDLFPKPRIEYLKKAYDIQKPWGKELLMRIIRKFLIYEEVDYIVGQLSSPEHGVREAALYCLTSFNLSHQQVAEIKKHFPLITNTEQQELVLQIISSSSEEVDVPFYVNLLRSQKDSIKLNAAEILWNRGYKDVVEQFYYAQYNQGNE